MGHFYNDDHSPNSSMEHGLVVELPDGKLFKLSDPNGRVVEMPNGTVVEMLDGQVVEMSNGQQLAMVDGNLVETLAAFIDINDGDVVGHRILSDEEQRHKKHKNLRNNNNMAPPPAAPGPSAVSMEELERIRTEQQRLRDQERATADKEQRLVAHQQHVAEKDQMLLEKQQQIQQQLTELKHQEEQMQRLRAQLAQEKTEIQRREMTAQKKESDARAMEASLEIQKREAFKSREELLKKEALISEKERDLQRASSASTNISVSIGKKGGSDDGSEMDPISAMENIEAGRIRFSELSLGTLLGSGSFADVYRSEWRMPCAIKKMKGRLTKEQMTEFVREGEMMRALRHPGIVRLLGVCVENGGFYLVQEIVNGYGNLFDYLHKPPVNRLTYWQVIQIAHGISDAMGYLHDKSIVHRDLKPQNCLLVNDRGQVKLCDFGLARLKRTAYVETVSNTAGTPAYQAPEMLRDEPISEKVDLYGFGIMLWEMSTGKLPWSDKNYHQMIHTVAVRNERPPITSDIPRELAQIVEQCWHPIPKSRPAFSDLKMAFKKLSDTVPCDVPNKSSKAEHVASSYQQHPGHHKNMQPPPQQQRFVQQAPSYPISAGPGHYGGNYQAW